MDAITGKKAGAKRIARPLIIRGRLRKKKKKEEKGRKRDRKREGKKKENFTRERKENIGDDLYLDTIRRGMMSGQRGIG